MLDQGELERSLPTNTSADEAEETIVTVDVLLLVAEGQRVGFRVREAKGKVGAVVIGAVGMEEGEWGDRLGWVLLLLLLAIEEVMGVRVLFLRRGVALGGCMGCCSR